MNPEAPLTMDPKRLALGSTKIVPKSQSKQKSSCNRPKKRVKRFLKGPIPWAWLSIAALASGQGAGLKVAMVLWHLFGLNKNKNPIKLSTKRLRELGVERHATAPLLFADEPASSHSIPGSLFR